MDQLFFTISFTYDIKPESLQVDLCAEIEMVDNETCLVRNIRRVNITEPSLLPVLKLVRSEGNWIHAGTEKESNISTKLGEAIDGHLKKVQKSRDEIEG